MFGFEGFFDLGSMILMSKNDINDVLGVFGRVWGCSEMKGFEVFLEVSGFSGTVGFWPQVRFHIFGNFGNSTS